MLTLFLDLVVEDVARIVTFAVSNRLNPTNAQIQTIRDCGYGICYCQRK